MLFIPLPRHICSSPHFAAVFLLQKRDVGLDSSYSIRLNLAPHTFCTQKASFSLNFEATFLFRSKLFFNFCFEQFFNLNGFSR